MLQYLRYEFQRAANPKNAAVMQAYMKSTMPFYGIQTKERRAICTRAYREFPLGSFEEWQTTALRIWREAQYREERYAALELTGYRAYRSFQILETLPMYEEMIVTGAWWDFVDVLAKERIGLLLELYPRPMRKTVLSWSRSENMWKRRSAILCQLGFKKVTDLTLLYACIESSLSSKEFFLQKAIGWALRQYAWTDPLEIKRYVRENGESLSALSRREALKNIGEV
ncbi:MAG: DNA alkylation repair protein [Bryobacteraceae bacterium]